MQLDWIDDNERKKYRERNDESRKLIRRRAIHAAIQTRGKRKDQTVESSNQVQELQPWVVDGSNRRSPVLRGVHFDNDTASANPHFGIPRSTLATSLADPLYQPRTPYWVPHRLISILQGQTANILQRLLSQSLFQDEQIRYFIVLSLTDSHYLQAICSCYGQTACLDAAIDCLTARVENCLAGSAGSPNTLRMYTHALLLLQKAVAKAAFSERFEIYYTIPMLVLFELLNPFDQVADITHAKGAVKLLHFIGPEEMDTQLNKTLLAMQSDIMVTENLVDGSSHCCAPVEWQQAVWRTIQNELPPGHSRSEANITLNIIATALPEAFSLVEEAVMHSETSAKSNLLDKLQKLRGEFWLWNQRWSPVLQSEYQNNQHLTMPNVLLSVLLMYSSILNRLISAISTTPEQCLVSEGEAFELATSALEIVEDVGFHDVLGQAKLAVVAKYVRSVIETSDNWQQEAAQTSWDLTVRRTMFMAWCLRIGRNYAVRMREIPAPSAG